MTAISATRPSAGATGFERSLLWTAATLDHFVNGRLERRARADRRRAIKAQRDHDDARSIAQARGGFGLLP